MFQIPSLLYVKILNRLKFRKKKKNRKKLRKKFGKNFRESLFKRNFVKKTFANFSFTIFRGTNFREYVQNSRKTQKFLPAKLCALKVNVNK